MNVKNRIGVVRRSWNNGGCNTRWHGESTRKCKKMREKGARNTRKKMKIEEVQRKNGYKTVRIVTTFPMKEADTIL
jgi:hypothetical protein